MISLMGKVAWRRPPARHGQAIQRVTVVHLPTRGPFLSDSSSQRGDVRAGRSFGVFAGLQGFPGFFHPGLLRSNLWEAERTVEGAHLLFPILRSARDS